MSTEHPEAIDQLRHVALLWDAQPRPKRGPRPSLSLDRIVWTAIGIADAEGLSAVSMQRVAEELGFTTMSLYRHVAGKDQLLAVMLERAAGLPPALEESSDWRTEVERWVRGLRELYERHPWMVGTRYASPPMGPNQLAWMEAGLSAISASGLPDEEALSAFLFLHAALWQWARLEQEDAETARRSGVSTEEADRAYSRALTEYAAPERFPTVARFAVGGLFGGAPPNREDPSEEAGSDFGLEFGLRRLLDGIQRHVEARSGGER